MSDEEKSGPQAEISQDEALRMRDALSELKGRFEYAGVGDAVARFYAGAIGLMFEQGATWKEALQWPEIGGIGVAKLVKARRALKP